MKHLIFCVVTTAVLSWNCGKPEAVEGSMRALRLHEEVNPFIGTGGHGHTYPGATSPFGMVQLSPDTRLSGWDGCGGYHYTDSVIYGFSHTHLQGTGVSDYGDFLVMPCREFSPAAGVPVREAYKSRFSHGSEQARAGYYAVDLIDSRLRAELTTTTRVGIHRYTLLDDANHGDHPKDSLTLVFDLDHRDAVLEYSMYPLNDSTIVGHRLSDNWAREQHAYFAIRMSTPFYWQDQVYAGADGTEAVPVFSAKVGATDELIVRVGWSFVDIEGALKNLETEAPHSDFDAYVAANTEAWDEQLSRVDIEGGPDSLRRVFYTALYHSCTTPNTASDVDGRYRGTDLQVHTLQPVDGTHYTVFSLWDTFRALHPLLSWIEPERTRDFIRTMNRMYTDGGQLPVWELAANYTGCMIGYNSVPVIADAWTWGIKDFDADLALEGMLQAADSAHLGLPSYEEWGYIPMEHEHSSVSKTLEYAYDDACIAWFAEAIGSKETHQHIVDRFNRRALSYRNLFNPETGFIQPKRGASWLEGFDPREVNFNYTEANGWQYNFFTPQDINGHIALLGGDKAYLEKLELMFADDSQTTGRTQPDITGLIGQYAHGNEPSHHMAYLFNFVGRPDRTADLVSQIRDDLYADAPDGLSGNEDCGQMSAWYVWSTLGMYPVAPGSGFVVLGTPVFDRVTVTPHGSETSTLLSRKGEGRYVKSLFHGAQKHNESWISVADLREGGSWLFDMLPTPGRFGRPSSDRPQLALNSESFVPVPTIDAPRTYKGASCEIAITSIRPDLRHEYKISEKQAWQVYTLPFDVSGDFTVAARSIDPKGSISPVVRQDVVRVLHDWKLTLNAEFSNEYAAGGSNALVDGIKGGIASDPDYKTGEWQGYFDCDVEGTVDLGQVRSVNQISLGALRDIRPWIFLPQTVVFYASRDGKEWSLVEEIDCLESDFDEMPLLHRFVTDASFTARYIRFDATSYGPLPSYHLSAGSPSWMFLDELEIRVED